MDHLQLAGEVLSRGVGAVGCNRYRATGVVAVVGEEGGDPCRCVLSVIVDESSQGKELRLVILMVIAIDAQVLLQCLINPLHLTI